MAENKHTRIFDPGRCLTQDEMFAYEKGKLSSAERHLVEKHLLDCSLCSEALEGLSGLDPKETSNAVEQITERVWRKVGELESGRRRKAIIWMTSAAASIFIIVGLFFWQKEKRDDKMEDAFATVFDVPPMPAQQSDSLSSLKTKTLSDNSAGKNLTIEDERGNVGNGVFKDNLGPVINAAPDQNVVVENNYDANKITLGDVDVLDRISDNFYAMEEAKDDRKTNTDVPYRDSVANKQLYAINQQSHTDVTVTGSSTRAEKQKNFADDKITKRDPYKSDFDDDLKEENEARNGRQRDYQKPIVNGGTVAPGGNTVKNATVVPGNVPQAVNQNNLSGNIAMDSIAVSREDDAAVFDGSVVSDYEKVSSGYDLHNEGKYNEAVERFKQEVKADPTDMETRLFLGIDLLAINKPAEAIPHFDAVIKSGNGIQKEDASWYKALAYVKMKDRANAKILLTEIAGKPGRYQQKAKETLEAVK